MANIEGHGYTTEENYPDDISKLLEYADGMEEYINTFGDEETRPDAFQSLGATEVEMHTEAKNLLL